MAKRRVVKWKDLPRAEKLRLGKSVRTLARFLHRERELGNFEIVLPEGKFEKDFQVEVGPLVALEYRLSAAKVGPGREPGWYRHLAGDMGSTRRRVPMMLAIDRHGRPVLVPRKGSKPGFSRRGLTG